MPRTVSEDHTLLPIHTFRGQRVKVDVDSAAHPRYAKPALVPHRDPLTLGLMSDLTQSLIDEIKSAPEPVQRELWDFLLLLKKQQKEGREDLLPLAQAAWAADWDTPEEDAAWRDL